MESPLLCGILKAIATALTFPFSFIPLLLFRHDTINENDNDNDPPNEDTMRFTGVLWS